MEKIQVDLYKWDQNQLWQKTGDKVTGKPAEKVGRVLLEARPQIGDLVWYNGSAYEVRRVWLANFMDNWILSFKSPSFV